LQFWVVMGNYGLRMANGLIPIESHVRHIALNDFLDFALFLVGMAIAFSFPVTGGAYWRYMLALAAAILILGLRWRTYRRRVSNLIEQYLKEQNLPPEMFESISALVWRSYRPWRVWGYLSRKRGGR
jgi:hypothetical protein